MNFFDVIMRRQALENTVTKAKISGRRGRDGQNELVLDELVRRAVLRAS